MHVNRQFGREPPPPWGDGYDDEWPPSCDPCWERLAAPLAEAIILAPMPWALAKREVRHTKVGIEWLRQATAWLEIRGYAVLAGGNLSITEAGDAWARARVWRGK